MTTTRADIDAWAIRIHHQGDVVRQRCSYCHRYVTVTRDDDNGAASILHEPGPLCTGWAAITDALSEMLAPIHPALATVVGQPSLPPRRRR